VTGEAIYANQQAHTDEALDEQVQIAYDVYMEQIRRLADRFPTVQVVCQPGNHGDLGASYSNGANADRLLYMMLDESIRMSDMENITFIRNDSTLFTNFYVRGSRRSYEEDGHIGTSAGKRRWYSWMLRHEFDQAYRGHYHQFEIDSLHGDVNVYMTGSPKPPEEFEEALAEWTSPSATLHGVSDNRTTTWLYPVEFENA
jgi:hypothetical protein